MWQIRGRSRAQDPPHSCSRSSGNPGSTTQAPNAINERSHAAVTELERSFSSKSLAAPGVAVDQLGWA